MARWDPNARGRLARAALELFADQGFQETTVPQITERAGLTTRTFFRYFDDKREVLFAGDDDLRAAFVEVVKTAPAELSPMELVEHVIETGAPRVFGERFDELRAWRAIVASDGGLRERSLRKQHMVMDAAVAALRDRGHDEQAAEMLGHLAGTLMQLAVSRWMAQPVEVEPLSAYVRNTLAQFRSTVS